MATSADWLRQQVRDTQPLAQDRDAWERQPGESLRAFNAFTMYVEMGAAARSYTKVAKTLTEQGIYSNFHSALAMMKRWGKKWQWLARAEASDTDRRRRRQAAEEEALADDKRRRRGLAMTLENTAIRRMVGVKKEDSNEWEIPPLPAAALDAGDIRDLLEAAVKVNPPEIPQRITAQVSGQIQTGVTYDEHRTVELILRDERATALAARLLEQILRPEGSGALGPGGMGDLRE